MRNLSYENEYDLHSNGLVSKTHFHMKGFALGLVLKQRQKRTRKWPIRFQNSAISYFNNEEPPRGYATRNSHLFFIYFHLFLFLIFLLYHAFSRNWRI